MKRQVFENVFYKCISTGGGENMGTYYASSTMTYGASNLVHSYKIQRSKPLKWRVMIMEKKEETKRTSYPFILQRFIQIKCLPGQKFLQLNSQLHVIAYFSVIREFLPLPRVYQLLKRHDNTFNLARPSLSNQNFSLNYTYLS